MTENDTESERVQAGRVLRALRRMRVDIEVGRPVSPSALSLCMRKVGHRNALLFMWMALQAVAGKYRQAGRNDVVAALEHTAALVEAAFVQARGHTRSALPALLARGAPHPLRRFVHGRKRISHYQSRWIDADLDLVLCAHDVPWLDRGLTAWVCQQPDLRYRWTEHCLARLAYLADC